MHLRKRKRESETIAGNRSVRTHTHLERQEQSPHDPPNYGEDANRKPPKARVRLLLRLPRPTLWRFDLHNAARGLRHRHRLEFLHHRL